MVRLEDNEANYKNSKYDELYVKAVPMEEPPRQKLIQKMRDIFVEDCPWTTGLHRNADTTDASMGKKLSNSCF